MDLCKKEPPALLIQGVQEFNSGLYYECHETLEELWLQERAAVRELYQGILQVGVALYKQRQANYRGAVNLLVSHPNAYRMTGPDLNHLTIDCDPVYKSFSNPDPAMFNDSTRLASVYTADGETIYALGHNEY